MEQDAAGIVRALTAELDGGDVERLAEAMTASMAQAVEELASAAELRQEVLGAVRATVNAFLDGVGGARYTGTEIRPELIDLARTLARRGYEPTVLMKLGRVGQSVYWPALMRAAEQRITDTSTRLRVLNLMYDRFHRLVEDTLDAAIAVYQLERDRFVSGTHARRGEMIRAVLAGDELDVDGASGRLGVNLRFWHTGFALWEERSGADADDRMETYARALGEAVGPAATLSTPSGSHGLWLWVTTTSAPGPELCAAARGVRPPPGVRAAGGLAAQGLVGFRRTHEEALDAQRIAIEGVLPAPFLWYDEVEIESLLLSNRRGLGALVARELSGLSGRDATTARLRSTLLSFLRCGSSATLAARELGTHKNTVRYRVEQAEERLERPLARQELRLQLALMAVETLGDRMLPD